MDLISVLATVILIVTIGTLVVGVAAYAAFKLRDNRRPKRKDVHTAADGVHKPIFLQPYTPTKTTVDPAATES
jgi:hypothetical protein